MRKYTIPSVILLASMMFTACTSSTQNDTIKIAETTTAQSTAETAVGELKPDLPDEDWEGRTFRLLGEQNATYPQFDNFELVSDGEDGEIVNDAVFRRNTALEQQYNVKFSQELFENPTEQLTKTVLSSENRYDTAFCRLEGLAAPIQNQYTYDFNEVEYVDLDKPWWNKTANDTLTIFGKTYFASSDYALRDKSPTWLLVYNKELAAEYDIPNIADTVRDGQWTIDTMISYVNMVARDVNGNGEQNLEDMWGLTLGAYTAFPTMIIGCGNNLVKNVDNELEITMNNDRMIKSIEKVMELTCNLDKAFYANDWSGKVTYNYASTANVTFKAGLSLFTASVPYSLKGYSADCEFEYGIIPMPKLDESQESHYTMPDVTALFMGIPSSCPDSAFAGFMLEALSYASTDTTLVAYYEVSCKTKYTYDADSAEMLDLIFDGIVLEPALILKIGNLYKIVHDIPIKRQNNFASEYASNEAAALEDIATLKDVFAGK